MIPKLINRLYVWFINFWLGLYNLIITLSIPDKVKRKKYRKKYKEPRWA